MKIDKGSIVTRNSYNNDVIFVVTKIEGNVAYLKGTDVRLYADALLEDLVLAEATDEKGELLYGESHILCNQFHLSALEKISQNKLPYHVAFKKASYLNEKGEVVKPTEPNAYKFEAFLFDAFSTVDSMSILRVKREDEFAPVKNAEGVDSPETARALYKAFYHIS